MLHPLFIWKADCHISPALCMLIDNFARPARVLVLEESLTRTPEWIEVHGKSASGFLFVDDRERKISPQRHLHVCPIKKAQLRPTTDALFVDKFRLTDLPIRSISMIDRYGYRPFALPFFN